jgi:hypothetical protein
MKTSQITASTARLSDGWAAILEFPNGGRQQGGARHGSHDSALLTAKSMRRNRLDNPEFVVPDPAPHTLQDLSAKQPEAVYYTIRKYGEQFVGCTAAGAFTEYFSSLTACRDYIAANYNWQEVENAS